MIPLRDNIPALRRPWATYAIILANAVAFVAGLSLSPSEQNTLYHLFGVVPARYSNPQWALAVGYPEPGWYAFFTYMFLHGGLWHFALNMWCLWIFADNVEDVMGPLRFTLFYLAAGLSALGAHYALNLESMEPVIGASGAIAGVMGAYFLLFPHAKVTTLIPIFIIPYIVDLPAVAFLGIWFLTQFLSGLWSSVGPGQASPVAWWAHIGGFGAGMLLMPVFRQQRLCQLCWRGERDFRALFGR
jgi:membrane associated rhomboid family serine protease